MTDCNTHPHRVRVSLGAGGGGAHHPSCRVTDAEGLPLREVKLEYEVNIILMGFFLVGGWRDGGRVDLEGTVRYL